MKNKFLLGILISVLFIIGLLVSSCEITDPVEGLEVRLNTYSRETLVSSYIYDANTLHPLQESVTVTFSGSNASLIIDETNEPKTVFSSENGIFIFGIADGTNITSSNPVSVNVKLEAAGYETEYASLKINKPGNQVKNFFVTNPATLPDNSDNETFDGGNVDNSGSLQQTIQHTTAKGTNISLEGGTIIKDQNGSPLNGKLTISVTTIPLTTDNSYNVSQEMLTEDNELVDPVMKFSLSIVDAKGNVADNLSENMSFTLNIPDELILPFSEGESISVWKQNNETSYWEKAGEALFSSSSASKFSISTTGSLSGNTSEAGSLILGKSNQTCTATISISNLPDGFNSTIQFFDLNNSLVGTANNSPLELQIIDTGLELSSVRINADLSDPLNTGIELGSNISINCGLNDIALDFPTELMSVRCEIIGVCTARDPVVVVNPNISFSYRKEGSSTWQSGNLVNGIAFVTGLEIGAFYEITATYRDQTGNALFEILTAQDLQLIEVSNPDNLLSSGVNSGTTPPTLFMEIDIENECD